jgi:hypothetical protein
VVRLCRHLHWFLPEHLGKRSDIYASRTARKTMQHALTNDSHQHWSQVLGRHIRRVAAERVSSTRYVRHSRGTATPPVGSGTWKTDGPAREM